MHVTKSENGPLCAAYYQTLGMSPEEIADVVGWAPATVRRWLKDAQVKGYVATHVSFKPDKPIDQVYPLLTDRKQAKRFLACFGTHTLKDIIIVPRPDRRVGADTTDDNLRLVARAAALHLIDSLEDDEIVGVSFGRTLRHFVGGVRELYDADKGSKKNIQFVPLIGGLSVLTEAPEAFECSASTLASELARIFGDTRGQLFLPTPAFIPRAFLEGTNGVRRNERIRDAQEFVRSIPEYRRIFGAAEARNRDPEALIAKMDVMVTSVGGPLLSQDAGAQQRKEQRESGWLSTAGPIIDDEERTRIVNEGIVGDIVGHFITRDNVTSFPSDSIITEVNRRVFGVSPVDFQNCAERAVAGRKKKPGVIVVASSASKAAAVLSAAQRDCVTTLVIDKDLADEMEMLYPMLQDDGTGESERGMKSSRHGRGRPRSRG